MTVEYRTLHEVADELEVHVQTVRRWVKSGRLRAFKPGKEYRIRQDDLDAFLARREVNPKAGAPESREESAFVITGRMVEGRYVMTVLWNVPPEERDKYRADLHRVLTNGFLEGEMTPERARKLVGTA